MFSRNNPGQQTNTHAEPNPSAEDLSSLLIIEDAIIHSTIIGRIAEKAGYTATTARSFKDACDLLRMRHFDCITLDLGLGQHAGVEVLNHLSTIPCATPVMIISGSERAVCDETVNIGRSLGLTICEPLRKPVNLRMLRERLEQIRMQSRLQKPASSP
jgi:two-component system chemotaxis response regulator CheY